ncbi:MAG: Uma2 family endonuclease [Cyanobacteria bacterium]|nr:Uma2 family endonuclease [Cyanobacteriota bacterium]MDW8201572.1 Uma2 family endonuclease [Cyanobacteriota bacterium SKYGB_h_bin112]
MTKASITAPQPGSTLDLTDDLAECGWRYETITLADGTTTDIMVPLTEEEFLHPQEDYHLPNNTFHDRVSLDVKDILTRRYSDRPDVGVFHDLLIEWDIPGLKDHAPDVCVVFGVRNKEQQRTKFIVAHEGCRPVFVLEVVSPRYRKADRETKVVHYAQARVQDYVLIDRRHYRGQLLEEVIGYHLVADHYQPITPDEDGRIYCPTLGLWLSLRDSQVILEDGETGERLLTSTELQQQAQQAEQRAEQAEQRAEQAEQRAEQAEQRAERLAALLRSQGIDPDQVV